MYQPKHTASQHTTVTFSVTGFTASPHSAISSPDERLSTVTSTVNSLTRRQTGRQQVLCDVNLKNTLTVAQLHKKFPAFYTKRRLDKPKHPYPKPGVSNAHTHDTSITHIFMLPSYKQLRLPQGLLPSPFTHNVFHKYFLHPCMLHSRPLLSTTVPGEQYRSPSINSSVHFLPFTSKHRRQYPLSTPFHNYNTPLHNHTVILL